MLLWMYYLAVILFFGKDFSVTFVYESDSIESPSALTDLLFLHQIKPTVETKIYGVASIYKMPLFKPLPSEPPFSRLDSAAILHIGHCAIRSDMPEDTIMMTIKRNRILNIGFKFIVQRYGLNGKVSTYKTKLALLM